MAEEKKNKKNLIIAICAIAVVAIVAIVVAIIILSNKRIDDSFFVSDDTKIVLQMDSENLLGLNSEIIVPDDAYIIYFYSGNNVTDTKAYYKYEDEKTAKEAAEIFKNQEDNNYGNISVNGTYVILTMNKSTYEGMTTEDARQRVELMELLQEYSDQSKKLKEKTEEETLEEAGESEVIEIETVEEIEE